MTALLYPLGHYIMLFLKAIPPPSSSTSLPQQWHKPRVRGIKQDSVLNVMVKDPCKAAKESGKLNWRMLKAYQVKVLTVLKSKQRKGELEFIPQCMINFQIISILIDLLQTFVPLSMTSPCLLNFLNCCLKVQQS